jgi:BASS family bile acid:Na+ symporter
MLLRILETGVPLVAFLMMVAVGLDVTRDDLHRVAGRARMIAGVTLAQAVVLPAVAWVLAPIAGSDRLAGYLLLIAACPGGGMSNVYVYLARANTALSVVLTAVSCLGALVSMPAVFAACQLATGSPRDFALPLPTLFAQLLIMAVIPVSAGAWIRNRYPELERAHGRRFRVLCAAGVVAIVTIGIVQSASIIDAEFVAGGAAATALAAAGMVAGWLVGRLLDAPADDRFTLLVEFAVRNLAIAMVIEVSLLGHPDFVAFGALALLGQALLLGAAIRLRRSGRPRRDMNSEATKVTEPN